MNDDRMVWKRITCSNDIITDGRLDMSIAFKNWVIDEQEKDEDKMVEELKHKELLQDIKMTLRKVLSSETMTLDGRGKLNTVINIVNKEIIRIENIVDNHEKWENAPC